MASDNKIITSAGAKVLRLSKRYPPLRKGVQWLRLRRERHRLNAVPRIDAGPVHRLRKFMPEDLRLALECDRPDCLALDDRLRAAVTIQGPGAVNSGDRFALAHLVLRWRPDRVLEVGTHVGASTASMAIGLDEIGHSGSLDTVDIQDVNDAAERPWAPSGATPTPLEILQQLEVDKRVRFHTDDSLAYLSAGEDLFDLIFLDGDHSAPAVYREIPAACSRLRPGGVIILHDYFPDGRPLRSWGRLTPGPYLAVQRLRREGAPLRVLPLGSIPWRTQADSNMTTLAVLTINSEGA